MFNRLKDKWQVSAKQFRIIFIAFGCTGLTTAYLTRKIVSILGFGPETSWGWIVLVKIIMLLFGYQVLLLFYGALFGQWKFFWRYEKKLLQKLGLLKKPKVKTAVLASGSGTNADNLLKYFKENKSVSIGLIVCNKPGAGVLKVAENYGVPVLLIQKEIFFGGNGYIDELKNAGIDFIVLAGFLWKIPQSLIDAYRNKIINIHPALLPKYGGKGMYGNKVNEAVIAAGEKESGISIHFVNEHFDEGEIIFQTECPVKIDDTPETLAKRIHQLEYEHYPKVVEKLIKKVF